MIIEVELCSPCSCLKAFIQALVPVRKGQICMRTLLPWQVKDAPVALYVFLCAVMCIKVSKSIPLCTSYILH